MTSQKDPQYFKTYNKIIGALILKIGKAIHAPIATVGRRIVIKSIHRNSQKNNTEMELQKLDSYSPESFNLNLVLSIHSRKGGKQYPTAAMKLNSTKRFRRKGNEIVREFQCNVCDKSYGCKSHLNTHRRLKGHFQFELKAEK